MHQVRGTEPSRQIVQIVQGAGVDVVDQPNAERVAERHAGDVAQALQRPGQLWALTLDALQMSQVLGLQDLLVAVLLTGKDKSLVDLFHRLVLGVVDHDHHLLRQGRRRKDLDDREK